MERKEYNGWTNYETWSINLWITNDEGSSDYWNERAQEYLKDAKGDKETASIGLASEIQMQHEEAIEEKMKDQNNFMTDMLNAAMSEVNWDEIAESILAEIEVEAE